jgi:nuclear pore complex protein Nup107
MFGGRREFVKSLDPDAPHRENLPLHDLDMDDQKRLTKFIFNCIRQGKIDEAQNLCEHCGQPWQAALLEGWRLFHDPNYDSIENKDIKMPVEGNPRRDLWKRCAFMMADSRKLDDYTKAVVGSFCGHLESLSNVCGESWWDLLWAYLKVQIDIRVESEIRSCCARNYSEMPSKYWDGKMSLERIFSELDGNKNSSVKTAAKSSFATIQKLLILDDITALLSHMNEVINNDDTTPQMLRFYAHLVLFIRQIGRNHQEAIGDRIIRAYVQCLIQIGDPQLVAFYTAALPNAHQVQIYSEFLESVSESSRRNCMEEAKSHGLDIEYIAKVTVERIQNVMENPNDAKLLTGEISELDKKKISSLDFLLFDQDQRGELLWQANAMIRYFMAQRKIEAVKKAFTMVPTDSIQLLVQFYGGKNKLPQKAECSIREYLCHQTYLAAIDGYNEWVEFFYNKKPKPPQSSAGRNFAEKAASEHQELMYKQELDRWKNVLKEQTASTKELLYNVLMFPDKGWLVDGDEVHMEYSSDDDVTVWENRKIQMDNLRKIHIPDIVALLHKILTLAEQHRECMKLVDDIANEQNQLYQVFSKHKMSEFLSKIAESSLALMNEKLDPFGFSNI